jgi:(p)ppGpp synthase/HD superfamily hydrolase
VKIAQTNLQLFNQLRERELPLDELVEIRRAYELLTTLYAGHYQADGKPFAAHGVGVASILAWLDQPAEIVAMGLLHNIYGNADFGDGLEFTITPARRKLVINAVGPRVEQLLGRFQELRPAMQTIEDVRRELPGWNESDRSLVLVELADHLEKYVDLGVLYFGENDWIVGRTDSVGAELIEIANELGEPRLAEMLSKAFDEAAAQADGFPAELRPSAGRRYLELVVPRSCSPRLSLRLKAMVRPARARIRLRARVRRSIELGRSLRARRVG